LNVKPSSELTPEEKAELAKYLPEEIDVNTMADIFYFVFHNLPKIKEKYGKVEPWGVDALKVKNFIQSLSEFGIKFTKINEKQTIPVERVLSKPCLNKWRLALAIAHLELKHKAPPICVNAYKVEGIGYWYVVTNGIHRVTAAKMMGQQEIQAEVVREIILDCAAICRNYQKSSTENYLLEVLGIKRSLRGGVELVWKTIKSIKSELND
jgi:uncharacterized ParB-like nuclease family protein